MYLDKNATLQQNEMRDNIIIIIPNNYTEGII